MEKYGLIGYPLRHSFSIGYFNEKFKSEGINAEYVNFEIPSINNFMEVIEENPNLCRYRIDRRRTGRSIEHLAGLRSGRYRCA